MQYFSGRLGLPGLVGAALLLIVPALALPAPPDPAPDPSGPANIFYGSVLPTATSGPILVFVHGLNGRAADWWLNEVAGTPNLMYPMAYAAGYRTVFVNINADNTRNNEPWQSNGPKLKSYLQTVSQHFNGARFYLIGHSEGGLDIQAALLNPQYNALDTAIAPMVKAVFTIGTPNQGTALADWAFGPGFSIANSLGLTSPAVQSLQVATLIPFRQTADPVFAKAGIQFYTYGGNTSGGGDKPSLVLSTVGLILKGLQPGANDGLVPTASVHLPFSYAMDLGLNGVNHYLLLEGENTFPAIDGPVQGLEKQMPGFNKIATGGFGDDSNSFAWSSAWFKGKLYIGTGREVRCVSVLAGDIQQGYHNYPPPDGTCPDDPKHLRLQAEIWQYTPETKAWIRVYQSPNDIPIGTDLQGNPAFTAEDSGFRGMIVFTETDGTQALYVAGVTAGEIYGNAAPYTFQTYPGPRILRSTDGVNFAALPHAPGTYLGDISKNAPPTANVFGFRAFAAYKGMLFATACNYFGDGYIIASANPSTGNNAWFTAGPAFSELPVWELEVFNGQLYAAVGHPDITTSFVVSKTDATGPPPFHFTKVVDAGTTSPKVAAGALSMEVFKGDLYVGTDGPTELIRIHPDDTWDMVIGTARNTAQGIKTPISGVGDFFGNQFNRHFWRLGVVPSGPHAGLYMTTYDWGVQLKGLWEFANLVLGDWGTDVYMSKDGVSWKAVTTTGFGDGYNYGARSITITPFGTFFGTGRFEGGVQIWQDQTQLDFNGDGAIDQNDIVFLTTQVGHPASGPDDPMDLDRDGAITVNDVRKLVTQCTKPGCAVVPLPTILPPPGNLVAATSNVTSNVQLTWDPVPGAIRYHVYRQTNQPLLSLLPPGGLILKLGPIKINIPEDIFNGTFDSICPPDFSSTLTLCQPIYVVELSALPGNTLGFPSPLVEAGVTASPGYQEAAPTPLQSIYFVRAEDAQGNRSEASNLVGAPSQAGITPAGVTTSGPGVSKIPVIQ